MAYKTPGVYTEEISLLPPSVAEVESALPAFVGYTARAERRSQDLTLEPVRIGSMLEYEELFGGPPTPELAAVALDKTGAVERVQFEDGGHYHTYLAVRHFFDNGGGDCYIVSVGAFGDTVDDAELKAGIEAVAAVDEPTILLAPDACLLGEDTATPGTVDNNAFYALQQTMLGQCARLGDRVAVFDLKENTQDGPAAERFDAAVDEFRDRIGVNGLKYGAAYGPWLVTTYDPDVPFALFHDKVTFSGTPVPLNNDSNPDRNALVDRASQTLADRAALETALAGLRDNGAAPDFASLATRYRRFRFSVLDEIRADTPDADDIRAAFDGLVAVVRDVAEGLATFRADAVGGRALRSAISAIAGPVYTGLIAFEKHDAVDDFTGDNDAAVDAAYAESERAGFVDASAVSATAVDPTGGAAAIEDQAANALAALDALVTGEGGLLPFVDAVAEAADNEVATAEQALYDGYPFVASLRDAVSRALATVPPSGAVAGAYALVDRTRGVFKAPANVSLSYVAEPTVRIGDARQETLNVDAIGGKSVNAIRSFAGRGTLIWGARTLAGNDNEWRYVPVRRLFNLIEESVKKSTAWAVFEPNDANLWVKVKGMIDNYLTGKWQEGALAGAAPADAFYTAVGLGQTMTPQDVLEGRLIVEIGLAAVRPAEFIVLRFSHKLQQS